MRIMPPVVPAADAWEAPQWLVGSEDAFLGSPAWLFARKVAAWVQGAPQWFATHVQGAPQWFATHEPPYVCDANYDWSQSDSAAVHESIEKVRKAFVGDEPLEHLPLLPCTIALVPILVVVSLLPMCCFALCCRRRHAYIKLVEDMEAPATPPRPTVPRLGASPPSSRRLARTGPANVAETPSSIIATPGSVISGAAADDLSDFGTPVATPPSKANALVSMSPTPGSAGGSRGGGLLSRGKGTGTRSPTRRLGLGSPSSSSLGKLVMRGSPSSPEPVGVPGHLAIKPGLPDFDKEVSKEGKPLVRTHISPLPSLRGLFVKKKGKNAVGLFSSRKGRTSSSSPTLPGTNDYPMAAVLMRLLGAPETGDDAPDSARSGQSTFRQNSARWRTPRGHIDNTEHKERIIKARGKTEHHLNPEQKAARQELQRKKDATRELEMKRQRELFEKDAAQYEAMQQRVHEDTLKRSQDGFAVLRAT